MIRKNNFANVIVGLIAFIGGVAWGQAAPSGAVTLSQTLPPLTASAGAASIAGKANMVWVDARDVSWTLPDAAGQRARESSAPRHSAGFYMDRTEVTNRQFAQFLSAADSHAVFFDPRMEIVETGKRQFLPRAGREDYPATFVDFMGAFAFARWAGKSLPSEEEWMIAALNKREAHSSDAILSATDSTAQRSLCNNFSAQEFPALKPVGSYPRGAVGGIVDLAGNAAEWTTTEIAAPLSGGGKTSWMIVKGGSYLDSFHSMTVQHRALHDRSERLSSVGFRCILRAPHTP